MLRKSKCLGTVCPMIGIDSTSRKFTWSWGAFREYNALNLYGPGEYIDYHEPMQSFHAHARNRAVSKMLGDWLFFLDTDHQFDPDLLCRMLRSAKEINAPVLSGLYMSRYTTHHPIVFGDAGDYRGFVISHIMSKEEGKEPSPVSQMWAGGAGCLLVQKWVFQRIWTELNQAPFAPLASLPKDNYLDEGCYSEDRSFFLRCQALNIDRYVDWRIECNHLITKALTYRDFLKGARIDPRQRVTAEATPKESVEPPGSPEVNGQPEEEVAAVG